MCQEVYQIVKHINLRSADSQLVLQCAPFITGLRISNLLMVDKESEDTIRIVLKYTGISYFRLAEAGKKIAFLLFRRNSLEEYLRRPEAVLILKKCGYDNMAFGAILKSFRDRYEAYMKGGINFPHEMGLLLGYPIEDVQGFIINDGKNSLYNGYWKVYSNVSSKKKMFKDFELAKENLIQLLANDIDIKLILEIFNNDVGYKKVV